MRKKNHILIFLICITGFFISCNSKNEKRNFFDIPGYFSGEIRFLQQSNYMLKKFSVYNKDTTIVEIPANKVNWDKEFALFKDADINKALYWANMSSKTESYHQQRVTTTYTANSDKLSIKKVAITTTLDDTTSVAIEVEKSNLISHTSISMVYNKRLSYYIEGKQKINGVRQNHFYVNGYLHR